jgi:hypothetical protein
MTKTKYNMHNNKHRKQLAHHLDKRLRFRLRIFIVVAIIMIGIALFDIITGKIEICISILAIAAGIIVGIISSRMYHISWNQDAQKVVSQFDIVGGIILAVYILFELKQKSLVGFFIQGPELEAASFAVLSGTMIGRVLGTRGKIMEVLKEQEVFG